MADALMSADPTILLQQASVWQQDGKEQLAEEAYRRVLAVDPTNADAMNLLALVHNAHGQYEQAVKLLRAAISIHPAGRFYTNLGVVLSAYGDRTGSIAAFRLAARQNPNSIVPWPGTIFAMDLHPYSLPHVRLADRREFNRIHCAALTASAPPHENDPDPDRKLKIGYLSGDFRHHSASMVFAPVLQGHNHDNVEVFCYFNEEPERPADEVTDQFKALADHWCQANEFDDDALAQKIREDRIDILVDLSGYSNGYRLLALARKPAPIIATGWGHVTGLGIDACDYIMADSVSAPVEHEAYYHERILRLPCIVSFDPRPPYPEVAEPPANANGYISFGYLGRANKTSEAVWAVWSKILHQVPGSRLLLKGADYKSDEFRQKVLDFFISLRVSSHRLEFRPATPRQNQLRAHHDVDIMLDPFPQGGGVTTLEACLMGVPSVALLGNYLNGRIAPSIMYAIGARSGVVAQSEDEYVDEAVKLAGQQRTLEDRLLLRKRLLESVLCRPERYATAVEMAYRRAWRDWCDARRGEVAA